MKPEFGFETVGKRRFRQIPRDDLRFVGEVDGDLARTLKYYMYATFSFFLPQVEAAYLARIATDCDGPPIVLCLRTDPPGDPMVFERVQSSAREILLDGDELCIVFLDDVLERRVRTVCEPFYAVR